MRFYKKGTFWCGSVMVVLLVLVIIYTFKFNNSNFILSVGFDGKCRDINIPTLSSFFVTVFSIIVTAVIGFWRYFLLKEKDDKFNEMNRMKNYLFNNLKHEEYRQKIDLSYEEIVDEYCAQKENGSESLKKVEKNIEGLDIPAR